MIRLKELRKRDGLSQQSLAKKLGVSRSTVAMWESRTEPSNEMLQSLARFFCVSVDYLLGGTAYAGQEPGTTIIANDEVLPAEHNSLPDDSIGENIRKMRKEQGMSQVKLSRLSGISQSAISDIENPRATKRPNTDTISKIASALGCTVAELMGEKPTRDEPIPQLFPSSAKNQGGLTDDELELIRLYRTLNRETQTVLLSTARGFAGNPDMQKEESNTATA